MSLALLEIMLHNHSARFERAVTSMALGLSDQEIREAPVLAVSTETELLTNFSPPPPLRSPEED